MKNIIEKVTSVLKLFKKSNSFSRASQKYGKAEGLKRWTSLKEKVDPEGS